MYGYSYSYNTFSNILLFSFFNRTRDFFRFFCGNDVAVLISRQIMLEKWPTLFLHLFF